MIRVAPRMFALTLSLAIAACDRPKPLSTGELFSILPDAVTTFDYETPDIRVSAHRFNENDRFQVIVETRHENGFTHCTAGAGFKLALEPFESMSTRRRLEHRTA